MGSGLSEPVLPAQGQPLRGLGQSLRGLGQPLRGLRGGGMDGRRDGWTYGRTDSPYSTGLCLLRFPPEPLPKNQTPQKVAIHIRKDKTLYNSMDSMVYYKPMQITMRRLQPGHQSKLVDETKSRCAVFVIDPALSES